MILQINPEITLRQISMDDASDVFNAIDQQREYLGRWLPFVGFTTKPEHTQAFISTISKVPLEEREYIFTIRKNDRFIGLIGFRDTDRSNRKTEIGYWLLDEFQGQGIITQSVAKLCDFAFAFAKLGLNRIQIKCAVGNEPSRRIPKRLNFIFEGIERAGERFSDEVYFDLEIFSKLRSDL